MNTVSPLADASALFVHGIGNQKPGSLLNSWASPVAGIVADVARQNGWQTERRQDADMITLIAVRGEEKRTVELRECVWSESFTRPGRLEMLRWLVLRIPAIFLLLFPDGQDLRRLDDGSRRLNTLKAVINYIVRVFLLFGIPCTALTSFALLTQLHPAIQTIVAVLLIILLPLAAITHRRWNIAGHVKIAATGGTEYQRIVEAVEHSILQASPRSRATTIVAHSQGGYLAHDALSQAGPHVKRLIGLGSGLRPISLLRAVQGPWGVTFLWAWAAFSVAISVVTFSLLHTASGILLFNHVFGIIKTAQVAVLTAQIIDPSWLIEQVSSLPQSPDLRSTLPGLRSATVTFLVVAALSTVVWITAQRHLSPTSIRSLNDRTEWFEVSTPHDVVGRIPLPQLPTTAQELITQVEGNPLTDHLRYFSRTSLVPHLVAGKLLDDAGITDHAWSTSRTQAVVRTQSGLVRRRWRAATVTALVLTAPFAVPLLAMTPDLMTFLAVCTAFTLLMLAPRLVQYIANALLRGRDLARALESDENMPASLSPSDTDIVAGILMVVNGLLGVWSFAFWVILIANGLLPATPGAPAMLIAAISQVVCGVVLLSGYRLRTLAQGIASLPLIAALVMVFLRPVAIWFLPVGTLPCLFMLLLGLFHRPAGSMFLSLVRYLDRALW